MRKKILAALALLLGMVTPLQGKIMEAAHFHELEKHVTNDTLVLLDVDDTVLVPEWNPFSKRSAFHFRDE